MSRCLFIGLGAVLALSSCSTISHTSKVADIETKVYNLTVAELDVKPEKATATAQWKWTPFSSFNLSEAKDNVTAQLLKTEGGDVLVEPQFEVKRRGFMRGGTITVTGFPALYRNFHNMTAEEASMLNPPTTIVSPNTYPVMGQPGKKQKSITPVIARRKNVREPYSFVNLLGGPSIDIENDLDIGWNFGVMYGHVGQSKGFYVKAVVNNMSIDSYYDEKDSKTCFAITGGYIKRVGNNVNVFGGLGVGTHQVRGRNYEYRHYYNTAESEFTIPLELGALVRLGKINVGAGITWMTPVSGDASGNLQPFLALGYTF